MLHVENNTTISVRIGEIVVFENENGEDEKGLIVGISQTDTNHVVIMHTIGKDMDLYASDIDVSKIKENLAFDEILYNLSKSIELRTIEDIEFINDLKKEENI